MSLFLKDAAHAFTKTTLEVDWIWRLLSRTFIRASQFLCSVKGEVDADRAISTDRHLSGIWSNRIIASGLFAGMKYGNTKARCSALHPKILGTYEAELIPYFEQILSKKPTLIADIGAADGYYAVGFALRCPTSKIIAFEQSERARLELQKLAELNGVKGRIRVKGICEQKDMLELPRDTGLIILDCEGAEDSLLQTDVIAHLSKSTFIVETHDGFVPGTTCSLEARFAETHKTFRVEAIHDIDRPTYFWPFSQADSAELEKRQLLLEARMHATLRWLICLPKNTS